MPKKANDVEERIQDALIALNEIPGLSIARAAKDFRIPSGRLYRRYNGISPLESRPRTYGRLTIPEEAALYRYIDRLNALCLSMRKDLIRDTAEYIFREKLPEGESLETPLSRDWVARFLYRYLKYRVISIKKLNFKRRKAEDINSLNNYFNKLR